MFAVFTGAPGAGKSTTIQLLADAGCIVMPEIATEVINEGIHQPWLGDPEQLAFQMEVAKRQTAQEQHLAQFKDKVVYLDRGLIDPIAYRLIYGRPLCDMHREMTAEHYLVAFLFDPVEGWDDNGVRYEDPIFAREMTHVMKRVYQSFGVPIVSVPNGTKEQRLEIVTSTMSRLASAPAGKIWTAEQISMAA